VIGRGGMAEVYRAHDRVLDRAVAVKLMRQASGDEKDRARFADEARMLAKLSHPGPVTILDAATGSEQPYLVMELVNGPSLAECCQGVALDPTRAAAIGVQLAEALAYAHDNGIVHRDLNRPAEATTVRTAREKATGATRGRTPTSGPREPEKRREEPEKKREELAKKREELRKQQEEEGGGEEARPGQAMSARAAGGSVICGRYCSSTCATCLAISWGLNGFTT
jgi:hypothetical protein